MRLPENHPDFENHAYCPDCESEYELKPVGDDWVYYCFSCRKLLTSAHYRAENPDLCGDLHDEHDEPARFHPDDEIAESFFNADEPQPTRAKS